MDAVKAHIRESITTTLFVGLVSLCLVYGVVFISSAIRAIYADHQDLVSRGSELAKEVEDYRSRMEAKDKTIKELQSLATKPSLPPVPRRLSASDRAFMRRALVRSDQKKVIVCIPKLDSFSDQVERSRYARDFFDLFKEAGWNPNILEDAKLPEDLPGVRFAVYAPNPPDSWPDSSQIADALKSVGIAFGKTALPMSFFGNGIGASDLIMCIGSR
jgi:hypothetical protein